MTGSSPSDVTLRQDSSVADRAGGSGREVFFVRLWAVATMCHILVQWGGRLGPTTAAALFAAVLVLFYPRSAHSFVLLALAQVVDTAVLMPNTPDHQYLAALVNLAVLAEFVRHRPRGTDELVRGVAPTARWVLLIAYSAAVVAKYNSDFLDVTRSCASFVAHTASFGAIPMHGWLAGGFVVGTLVGETSVATLLWIPRTRAWGVVVGIGFHFLVSLSPAISVGDFSTTLWALFLLFLLPQTRESIMRGVSQQWDAAPSRTGLGRIPRAGWAGAGVLAVAFVARSSESSILAVWLFTTLVGPWLFITVLRAVWSARGACGSPLGRPAATQSLSLVLVVMLAASPYLGMGTSSRFTMFSSLRTEGPGSNHLFMPSLDLGTAQDDYLLVDKVYGSSDTLDRARESRSAVPTVEVRRILADRSRGGVFTTPTGGRVEVLPGEDHELRVQAPWWQRKTQHYRPYRLEGVTVDAFCSN